MGRASYIIFMKDYDDKLFFYGIKCIDAQDDQERALRFHIDFIKPSWSLSWTDKRVTFVLLLRNHINWTFEWGTISHSISVWSVVPVRLSCAATAWSCSPCRCWVSWSVRLSVPRSWVSWVPAWLAYVGCSTAGTRWLWANACTTAAPTSRGPSFEWWWPYALAEARQTENTTTHDEQEKNNKYLNGNNGK